MAAAYQARTADPLDNDATGNPGPTTVFADPTGLLAGDYLFCFNGYKSTSTTIAIANTTTGGQTWVESTHNYGGATSSLMSRMAYCKFNGTLDASVVFTMDNAGTSPMSGIMVAIRGLDQTTVIDAAEQRTASAAPGTPFDMSIPEITTVTDNAMVLAFWFFANDATCALQTAGWANPASETQWRNLAGADCGVSVGYKIITPAGGSGAVVNRQSIVTGLTWNGHIVALRPAAGAAAVPTRGLTLVGVR